MERHDLERIQFVTRHFGELKGLAGKVPLGLFILGSFGSLRVGLLFGAFASLACLLGGIYLATLAHAYYSREFGYVETMGATGRPRSRLAAYVLDGPPLRSIMVVLAGALAVLVPSAILAAEFHSMTCVVWSGWLLVSWVRKRCPASQVYYPLLVLFLLAFARWHGGPVGADTPRDGVNDIACGVMLVVAGLLDHWQLVRNLEPVDEAEISALEEESR